VPVYRTLWRVIVPICLPAIVDIGVYLFVNAMTTVSAVVFLYSADTKLASIAILNLDDAGKTANAAAMGMTIVATSAGLRALQAWRCAASPAAPRPGAVADARRRSGLTEPQVVPIMFCT
jgi:ABC-type Fe3+ transport system permease subunit